MSSPPAPDSRGPLCPHCGDPHSSSYTHCPNTGKALTTGRALIGRVIAGKYRVIGLLGEGGMGAVYVAEHMLMGRKVAIKRLHPELASDEKAVQRFQREARAAAATGHEHIVEILDLGYAEDNAPYLVMEYLRGQTLAALLRKEQRLDVVRACDLVGQALAALESVHREGILHRDLKPENLFLTRGSGGADWVKILDFGISKMKHEEGEGFDLTRTGVMLGTPFYMSPEQARGMKVLDHRVDLYAMGMILYECLTGRVAFEGDNYHQLLQSILRTSPPTPRSIAPDIDIALEALIMKAISKDPADRFQSAEEMRSALRVFRRTSATRPLPRSSIDTLNGLPIRSTVPPPDVTNTETGLTRAPGSRSPRSPLLPRPSSESELARSTVSGGPRRFFAASDDWDEERARAAVRMPGRDSPLSSRPAGLSRRTSSSLPATSSGELAALAPLTPVPRASSSALETELKGSLFSAALEHIETAYGRSAVALVQQHLEPESREQLSGVILPMVWLPLALYDQLLRAVERVVGGAEGTTASGIGRSTADRELPTTHRLFLQSATPTLAVERIPQFYRLYHSRGEAKVTPTPGAGVRVEIDALTPESFSYAWTLAGFWQRMLELTGARDVRAGVVSCRGRGDDKTAITLRWR